MTNDMFGPLVDAFFKVVIGTVVGALVAGLAIGWAVGHFLF